MLCIEALFVFASCCIVSGVADLGSTLASLALFCISRFRMLVIHACWPVIYVSATVM